MHPDVHCGTIYSGQNMEALRCPLTEGWIKMWHIYIMEYYSAMKKNEIMLLTETWVELEIVIQSEVRKTNTV